MIASRATDEMADFFISYCGADIAWARWTDWALREHGYETRIQIYDFKIGDSFIRSRM